MDTNSIQVLVIYSLDSSSASFCDIMESISRKRLENSHLGFFQNPFVAPSPYCHISELVLFLSIIKFRDIKSWTYGIEKTLEKKYIYLFFFTEKFVVAQFLSRIRLFTTPWTAAHQASLTFTISQSLLKLMSIESVMPSNHLILCCSLLLLPSVFPSIRVFSKELVLCIRWPKYWSFSFSISPSNEYSGLISFMMDWLDLPAVHGTFKSLLQHHSPKASILWCSAFFIAQLSHPYMTTGKTIALTR